MAFLLAASAPTDLRAQAGCEPPPLPPVPAGLNIFTERQEVELGDIIAEHIGRDFRVIEDDVAENLRRIGDRIVRHLPSTDLQFRFYLVDVPRADAFALPGGRIYVSRKLIAAARNEDELAGVLAHECGHVIGHDSAVVMTRAFRELLHVTGLRDRQDILDKYSRLIDTVVRLGKRPPRDTKGRLGRQMGADQVALYAVVRAGYSPKAFVDFFDRLTETHGKTGNWLSDLFGMTPPESRRLRQMLEAVSRLPAACVGRRESSAEEEFQKWRASVIDYSGLGRREALRGVVFKKALEPPLRTDISHLRFSPDGKYLLAQDDASIYVISRESFNYLFRIDAPEAFPAQFTPDSTSIVFHTPSLRVEQWGIEDERRTAAHELVIHDSCLQTALSSDGRILACLAANFDVVLMEVPSGAEIFRQKDFFPFGRSFLRTIFSRIAARRPVIPMVFSPDNRYFIAAVAGKCVAIHLASRQRVSLPGSIRQLLPVSFVFIGPDRLAGINPFNLSKSALVRFPSGELITHLPLGPQRLAAPAHGDYVLLSPANEYPIGVMNLQTQKLLIPGRSHAVDIYDQVFAKKEADGRIGLYDLKHVNEALATTSLPASRLGRPQAFELSSDLQWLAVSERSRGAVWNLSRGGRWLYTQGFNGAFFSSNGMLYADFPKFEEKPRAIHGFSLTLGWFDSGRKIEEGDVHQYARYLVAAHPLRQQRFRRPPGKLEVTETSAGKLLWSREFVHQLPRVFVDSQAGTMAWVWDADEKEAKGRMRLGPAPTTAAAQPRGDKGGHLLVEILGLENGQELGRLLVTGVGEASFVVTGVLAAADSVLISDLTGRVLLYSLSSGEQKGVFFGTRAIISKDGRLLAVEDEEGIWSIYDLDSRVRRDRLVFSNPIAGAQFTAESKRLFVLTADQTAYLLDLSAYSQPQGDHGAQGPLEPALPAR